MTDAQFAWMMDDLKNIEAHTPDTKEMEFLRSQYPTVFEARDKANSPTVKRTKKKSTSTDEDGE